MSAASLRNPLMHWWVQIQTTVPACQYYFGPFNSIEEAEAHQSGYVEDLVHENALEIVAKISRCQPEVLTLCDEEDSIPEIVKGLRHLSLHEQPTVVSCC